MGELATIVLLGLLIGAVLGGLGGGGAILTVPALVYVVGQPGQDATTSSLVIVGLTAAVGVGSYLSSRRVKWGVGLTFGAVGFPATWLGSYLNHRVDENILLLGFAALMLVAAAAMVLDQQRPREAATAQVSHARGPAVGATSIPTGTTSSARVSVLDRPAVAPTHPRTSPVVVVLAALGVGLLTGFFGVGGGFVIVPALVLVLRLPIHYAVGTSLMIVALNSATSLVSRASTAHFDWSVIVPFTLAAMAATLAGKRVADRLPAKQLKVGFAALLVLVAGYTAAHSIASLTKTDDTSAASNASPSQPAPDDILGAGDVAQAVDDGAGLVDVRTPEEFAAGHLTGAINIDSSSPDFDDRINNLDQGRAWVVYCATGNRAAGAVERMIDAGFPNVRNGGGFTDLSGSLPAQ